MPLPKNLNNFMTKKELKEKIWTVLDIIETGKVGGDYGNITILRDGPNESWQLTAGRHQATESGNLPELIEAYCKAGGWYSTEMAKFRPVFNSGKLHQNAPFKILFRKAANDPTMQTVQDDFFTAEYWDKAMEWAKENGFKENLSLLVIYDSFVHSGSIRTVIRNKFAEKPPAQGGNERKWIVEYSKARKKWLETNVKKILHGTAFRPALYLSLADADNWDLTKPFRVKGVKVA